MNISCPYCGQRYEVNDSMLNAAMSCEVCKKAFVVQETDEVDLSERSASDTGINLSSSNCKSKSKQKKLLLAGAIVGIAAIIFSSYRGSAKDAEKIEAVIRQRIEYAANGKFLEVFKLFSDDYVYRDKQSGCIVTLEYMKLKSLSLDGEHPQEYLRVLALEANGFRPLSPQKEREIARRSKKPYFISIYKRECKRLVGVIKDESKIHLQTLKIINIEIKGNTAIAAYEQSSKDSRTGKLSPGKIKLKFKKIRGEWKISEIL